MKKLNKSDIEKSLASLEASTRALVNIDDPDSILRTIAEQVRQVADLEECSIILFEDEMSGTVVASTDGPDVTGTGINISDYPELSRVIETRKPLFISDVETSPLLDEVKEVLDRKNILSLGVLPISTDEEMLGVLFLRLGRKGDLLGDVPLSYFQATANAAALALRNLRLKKDVISSERRTRDAMQEALEEREYRERYQNLFHLASDGLVIIDGKGQVVDINRKFEQLTGYTKDEAMHLNYLDLLAIEEREKAKKFFEGYRRDPESLRDYFQILSKSGGLIDVIVGIEPLSWETGQALLSLQDISEEKHLQNQLQRAKEFFENLIDSSVDAIIAADMKGKVILFNQGAENILGYRADEVIGKKNIVDIYVPSAAKDVMRKLRSSEYGGVGRLETTHYNLVGKNGVELPINVSATIIYEKGGEIASVGIFHDLRPRIAVESSLRAAQEQLIEAEKQAALSALSGATAHELNQPLTSIMGYAELLESKLTDSDEIVVKALNTITRETERMSEIIQKIGKVSQYKTRDYVGRTQILDIDKASIPSSRYENLFLSMKDGLIEFKYDEEGNLGESVFANPATARLLGYSGIGDLLDRSAQELFKTPDIGKRIEDEVKGDHTGNPITVKVKRSDYTEVIIEMMANLIEAEDSPPAVELLCRDVTERTKVQEELEEAERHARTLVEMAGEVGMGLMMLALDEPDRGEVIFANERFEDILGCKVNELRTFPILNLIKPDDREKFIDIFRKAINEDVGAYYIESMESEVVRRDGTFVPVEFLASTTMYLGRRVLIGFLHDVTKWVATREELRELKEFSESIVNNAPTGIATVDANGIVLSINDRYMEIMGVPTREYSVGAGLFDLSTIAGTEIERLIESWLNGEQISIPRIPYTSVTGKSMILRAAGVPLTDEAGKPNGGILLLDDVTEEAELEESLRRERVYHDSLIEHSPVPIVGVAVDASIVLVNNATEELFGYSREEILGKNAFEVAGLQHLETSIFQETINNLKTMDPVKDFLIAIPTKHGDIVEITWNAVPVNDEKGEITGIVGIGHDVTEERRLARETTSRRKVLGAMHRITRASIEGSEFKHLCTLLSKELEGIITFDTLSIITLKEDKLEYRLLSSKIDGMPKRGSYPIKDTLFESLTKTKKPRLVKDFSKKRKLFKDDARVVEAGIRSSMNAPLVYQDKIIGTINVGNKTSDAFSEEDFSIFSQIVDEFAVALENIRLVEEISTSNKDLERKTRYLEALLQASRTFRIDTHERDVVLQYAENIEELFASPHLMIYLIDPETGKLIPTYTHLLPSEKTDQTLEIKGNTKKWLETSEDYIYYRNLNRVKSYNSLTPDAKSGLIVPIRIGDKRIGLFIAESHDTSPFEQDDIDLIVLMTRHMAASINNLQLYEQACFLERSQEDIIENAGALIVATNREGKVNIFNKAFEDFSGYSKAEILGRRGLDIFSDMDLEGSAKSIWKKVEKGRDLHNHVVNLRTKEGRPIKVVFNSTAVKDTRGKIAQYIFVGYDLTDREVLERQLAQSAKMATLGQMAAGIAHELNNPLTAISSYAQLLSQRIPKIGGTKKEITQIKKILEGTERIEQLISNLMDYSRMDYEEELPLSINEVMEEALTFSEYDLTRGKVRITKNLAPDLPLVSGVNSQLQQVFINILSNASFILQKEGGGEISIRSRRGAKKTIRVEIADNGPGMSSKQVERIFEPFYTTKPRGEGTGLGLSIVQDIVKKHGGDILVKTRPEKGSTFIVRLPICPDIEDK